MVFEPAFNASQPRTDDDLWFIFRNEKLVVHQNNSGYSIPQSPHVKELEPTLAGAQFFGLLDGAPCFFAELPEAAPLSEGFDCRGIFELLGSVENEPLLVAGCASQLIRWSRSHRYCGQCRRPTEDKEDERARVCRECRLTYYPRLSPAVIVAVVKNDNIGTTYRIVELSAIARDQFMADLFGRCLVHAVAVCGRSGAPQSHECLPAGQTAPTLQPGFALLATPDGRGQCIPGVVVFQPNEKSAPGRGFIRLVAGGRIRDTYELYEIKICLRWSDLRKSGWRCVGRDSDLAVYLAEASCNGVDLHLALHRSYRTLRFVSATMLQPWRRRAESRRSPAGRRADP